MSKGVDALEKAWKDQYFADSNFPEWTKSQSTITQALQLPEKECSPRGFEGPAACLMCDQVFGIPSRKNDFLKHLLEQHLLVISDVNLISDLPSYAKYWKTKFQSHDATEFCSKIKAAVSKDGKEDSEEKEFLLLSDVLQEDRDLRVQLQMKRLEEVLNIQEAERNDVGFKRSCLFCRTVFEGRHGELIDHMAHDHNFSVGQPNNLVFVKELLDLLEQRLNDNICIFCEKVFKTREVLKEHMRKKAHKKINPKNAAYDMFYLVNYREFGKNWESLSRENDYEEDELPNGFASEESGDDENDWSDWKGDHPGPVCLFCPATYGEMNDLLTHMTSIHDFDFQDIRNNLKLSFYQQIKLINYIRRQVHLNQCIHCSKSCGSNEALMEHMTEGGHLKMPADNEEWNQAQYYFPTYENDNLLSSLDDDVYENDPVPVESEDMPENVATSILNQKEFRDSICPTQRKGKSLGAVKK